MSHADVDVDLLRELIRSRRKSENQSLREAAEQVGVSAATLLRMENGQIPNRASLIRITEWLQVPLDQVLQKPMPRPAHGGTMAQIEVHLRADPHLDSHAAQAITEAVQKLYAAFSSQARGK
jgi:transcriptional regulator with XRE-family HTH domain